MYGRHPRRKGDDIGRGDAGRKRGRVSSSSNVEEDAVTRGSLRRACGRRGTTTAIARGALAPVGGSRVTNVAQKYLPPNWAPRLRVCRAKPSPCPRGRFADALARIDPTVGSDEVLVRPTWPYRPELGRRTDRRDREMVRRACRRAERRCACRTPGTGWPSLRNYWSHGRGSSCWRCRRTLAMNKLVLAPSVAGDLDLGRRLLPVFAL